MPPSRHDFSRATTWPDSRNPTGARQVACPSTASPPRAEGTIKQVRRALLNLCRRPRSCPVGRCPRGVSAGERFCDDRTGVARSIPSPQRQRIECKVLLIAISLASRRRRGCFSERSRPSRRRNTQIRAIPRGDTRCANPPARPASSRL